MSTQIDLILDLRRLAAAEMDTEVAGNTVRHVPGLYEPVLIDHVGRYEDSAV